MSDLHDAPPLARPPSARHGRAAVEARLASPALLTLVVLGAASPALLCGLETWVLATSGVLLAHSAGSLDDFLAGCARAGDCVALVDPFLGRWGIRRFMRELKAAAPKVRAVLMTDQHSPLAVRDALAAGACGFVGQCAGIDQVRSALSAAANGQRYLSPPVAAQLAESLKIEALTARESQVLQRLARGDSNKAIARDFDLGVGTVKTHVRAIMLKLGAQSRTEAVHKGYRLGLACLERG